MAPWVHGLNTLSKSSPTITTLVKELLNCIDYFFRLSVFPDLSGKVFLITFKFSLRAYSLYFAIAISIKNFNFFSFVKVQRDYNR